MELVEITLNRKSLYIQFYSDCTALGLHNLTKRWLNSIVYYFVYFRCLTSCELSFFSYEFSKNEYWPYLTSILHNTIMVLFMKVTSIAFWRVASVMITYNHAQTRKINSSTYSIMFPFLKYISWHVSTMLRIKYKLRNQTLFTQYLIIFSNPRKYTKRWISKIAMLIIIDINSENR